MDNPTSTQSASAWPYHAGRPQRYSSNYPIYSARGGLALPERDVQGFVAGGRNRDDMARFHFFLLACDQIAKEGLAGDFAELGVYKGNTAALLAQFARRLGRTLYLLDTFEGFSGKDLEGMDAGAQRDAFADTSLDAVRAAVGEEGVRFIRGYFPNTASEISGDTAFCIVHLDCDLYAPTAPQLTISTGGWSPADL